MTQASRSTLATQCLAVSILYFAGIMPFPAQAQTTAIAGVSGTVSDPTGAAVVGAPVTITETSKHTVFNTITDQSGAFLFPSLPVGPYRLEVKATGFKEYVQTG